MEDPDAPLPWPFVHLIATGIDPRSDGLREGALSGPTRPPGIVLGRNTFRRTDYAGPRPPSGHGPHRYVFQLFATDRKVVLSRPPSKGELLQPIAGTVIGRGRLDGMFERPRGAGGRLFAFLAAGTGGRRRLVALVWSRGGRKERCPSAGISEPARAEGTSHGRFG